MSNEHPSMTDADRRFLDTATPSAIEEKLWNKGSNPSSNDWMMVVPKNPKTQPDLTVTEDQIAEVLKALQASYFIFQLEKGKEDGYLHYQIFFQRPSKTRQSTIKKAFDDAGIVLGWTAPRRFKVSDCVAYCSKEDTREGVPIQWGEVKLNGSDKVTLDNLIDMIHAGDATVEDLLTSNRPEIQKAATIHATRLQRLEAALVNRKWSTKKRKVKVVYLWGSTRVGKTTLAREKAGASIYCVNNYRHPFDHYNYQKNLLLDDFRDTRLSLVEMLHILDSQPLQLDCRYFNKFAAWTTVFITSNLPPEALYLGVDSDSRDAFLARITEVWKVEEKTIKIYETEQRSKIKEYSYEEKQVIYLDKNSDD